jgi:hypothetical protein
MMSRSGRKGRLIKIRFRFAFARRGINFKWFVLINVIVFCCFGFAGFVLLFCFLNILAFPCILIGLLALPLCGAMLST